MLRVRRQQLLMQITAAARRLRNFCLGQRYERSLRNTYDNEKLPETCRWPFQEENYRRWKIVSGPACLWIHGQTGTGKTMLCSSIVGDLIKKEQENEVVSFFVSTEAFSGIDTALYVLDSLIYQLVRKGGETAPSSKLLSIHKRIEMLGPPVSADAFRQHLAMILEVLEPQARLVVALDGLQDDEWIKNAMVYEILDANILRDRSYHIRCIVTSNALSSVILHQKQIASIGMGCQVGVQRDIVLFAKARLAFYPQPTTEEGNLLETRARQLCLRANGSFSWVHLMTEVYGRNGQLKEVLENLNSLPSSLQELYRKMLQTVPAWRASTVQSIFSWLLAATRPLKLGELLEALLIEPDWHRPIMNEAYAMESLASKLVKLRFRRCVEGWSKLRKITL